MMAVATSWITGDYRGLARRITLRPHRNNSLRSFLADLFSTFTRSVPSGQCLARRWEGLYATTSSAGWWSALAMSIKQITLSSVFVADEGAVQTGTSSLLGTGTPEG